MVVATQLTGLGSIAALGVVGYSRLHWYLYQAECDLIAAYAQTVFGPDLVCPQPPFEVICTLPAVKQANGRYLIVKTKSLKEAKKSARAKAEEHARITDPGIPGIPSDVHEGGQEARTGAASSSDVAPSSTAGRLPPLPPLIDIEMIPVPLVTVPLVTGHGTMEQPKEEEE